MQYLQCCRLPKMQIRFWLRHPTGMAKRGRLATEALALADALNVSKGKLAALSDSDLREVDLETAVALGIERDKAAKLACRIRFDACACRRCRAVPRTRHRLTMHAPGHWLARRTGLSR